MDYRMFVKQEMAKDPPKSRAEASRKMREIARKWRAMRHSVRANPIRLDVGSALLGGLFGIAAAKLLFKG